MPSAITLAPQKRLDTGRSVWSANPHRPFAVQHLKNSLRCDVAIVGAGISGAFMAHELSRHYRDVVVLDRREPATGSTHASTAMLQFEIDTPLTALSDRMGAQKAERAWQISYQATQRLVRLVREENIACDIERRDSLYLTGDGLGWRGMKQEARARNRAGLSCEYLTGHALAARFGIARTGAICSAGSAVADPVALTHGLLCKAKRRGARVFASVDICNVMSTKHGVMLDAGTHFVEARHVVFCTGYEVIPGLMRPGSKITSSWAAATAPATAYPEWLNRTLVWEAAEPYLYMRTDGKGRLIVGGEDADLDSPSYRTETLNAKAKRLAGKTRQLLGVEPEWKHVWAGAFGESADGLPTIGEVPGLKGCFAVMGFGGNGTIYALIAAGMMPALLKGRVSADASLFAFR
jgi:glycine/D-amino acid oxidase-like deaminating enzyme